MKFILLESEALRKAKISILGSPIKSKRARKAVYVAELISTDKMAKR